MFTLAIVMRMVRATMLEVLGQDYVRTARAKGVKRKVVISRHALRNALIPVVTVVGFEVGILMGGSAIVEIIFGLPGIGNTLINAIFNRDYPVVQAATMMIAVHLHLREPRRRPPLRRPRPEDLAGMSNQGDFEAPVLAPEGPSEVGTGQWVYVPPRRAERFAKWKNPIGIAGAIIVGFNVFVALFGKYIWTVDPDELVATRLQDPSWAHPMGTDELGRDTLARIIHGAQVSLQVGLISVSIALVLGALDRPALRLLRRQGRQRC